MVYTQEHHNKVLDIQESLANVHNIITWSTNNAPFMVAEFDLLLALLSKDYNRIREEITPFFFSDENFTEDLLNMYNKVMEAELDKVYEDIMSELEIGYNEETNEILIQRWED